MNALLNPMNVPAMEAVAKSGAGVSETLVKISRMVFSYLRKSLLMPGETLEHEDLGQIADKRIEETFRKQEVEQLEEISEVEMIPEEQEGQKTASVSEESLVVETGALTESPVAGQEVLTASAEEPRVVEKACTAEEGLMEGLDEIEIVIPERPPAAPAASRETRAGVYVETEPGGLTFLKFENPFVSPEGHAVLPAVFMDGSGDIIRVRIRITMEEQ
jgi:hypothetical protein